MPPESLPKHAKEIYIAAEANALKTTCKDRPDKDACAAKIAWSAVKNKYKKVGNKWVPKDEAYSEFSLTITKAAYDKASGEMRFLATASDTEKDSYDERMSLQLFNDFTHRIGSKEKPPEEYCSEYWCGGEPYISISHYSDLGGEGVPGEITSTYIDGNQLKSKGKFYDTELGRACFRSVCESLYDETKSDQDKVRISIGFLDFAHRHGEILFSRESVKSRCPACAAGVGDKTFVSGLLIHEALTRVPVNKRTDIEAEVEKSMAITRKDDAASIVGDEEAEKLDELEKAKMVGKSEIEESEILVVKADEEKTDEEFENDDAIEDEPAKAPKKSKGKKVEAKTDACEPCAEAEVEKQMGEEAYRPYGGATSFEDAEAYLATLEETYQIYDSLSMFQGIMQNILTEDCAASDKKKLMKKALDGFKKSLEAKSMVIFEKLSQVELVQKSALAHPLDEVIAAMKVRFDEIITSEGTAEEKLQIVQPVYAGVGEKIRAMVMESCIKPEPEQTNVDTSNEALADKVVAKLEALLQPIKQDVQILNQQMSAIKSVSETRPVTPPRRSLTSPDILGQIRQVEEKPSSLHNIIRKSVGLPN